MKGHDVHEGQKAIVYPHPLDGIVRDFGWPDQAKDLVLVADWFDAHLKKPASQSN